MPTLNKKHIYLSCLSTPHPDSHPTHYPVLLLIFSFSYKRYGSEFIAILYQIKILLFHRNLELQSSQPVNQPSPSTGRYGMRVQLAKEKGINWLDELKDCCSLVGWVASACFVRRGLILSCCMMSEPIEPIMQKYLFFLFGSVVSSRPLVRSFSLLHSFFFFPLSFPSLLLLGRFASQSVGKSFKPIESIGPFPCACMSTSACRQGQLHILFDCIPSFSLHSSL